MKLKYRESGNVPGSFCGKKRNYRYIEMVKKWKYNVYIRSETIVKKVTIIN